MPCSSRIVCGFFNVPQNLYSRVMRRDLRLLVLSREDFADVVTKAALSPQLFKDPDEDLPHDEARLVFLVC